MDFLFPYHKQIDTSTGIVQTKFLNETEKLISSGKNLVYISPPKTGKRTIINCIINHFNKQSNCYCLEINLLHYFSRKKFLEKYKEIFISINESLNKHALLPLQLDYEKLTGSNILNLPEMISKAHEVKIIIFLHEFHNILSFDNCDDFLYEFEKGIIQHKSVQYFFSGSMINKMKYIFEEQKFFFNFVSILKVPYPSKDECFRYLDNKFMLVGKEIKRELTDLIFEICGGHPWYIMQLASNCHSITPGYVTVQIVYDSMERLLNIHDIRFKEIISNLTYNQFNLILGVLAHTKKFSSSETIKKFNLNSSAQIARSRDALLKKEIISFNSNNEAYIIDPLFEYWLRKHYLSDNK